MKINTIKARLFAVFVFSGLFISAIFIVAYYYYSKNENDLWKLNRKIDLSNHYLLRDIKVTRDFFSNETINPYYFESGESPYLVEHYAISSEFMSLINEISSKEAISKFELEDEIMRLSDDYKVYALNVDSIIKVINLRGFKDNGLEGRMRFYAHRLEQMSGRIGKEHVLVLRKHEKDFIIRQDNIYQDRLHHEVTILKKSINNKSDLSKSEKQVYTEYVSQYQSKFDSLVLIENIIGLKKQGGLKRAIDLQAEKIDHTLGSIAFSAFEKSMQSLHSIKMLLVLLLICLAIAGIILTFYISERISRSVNYLKTKIQDFIASDFSVKMALPLKESKYEIDILMQQFTLLQNHIETQMMALKDKNKELKTTFNELTNRFNDMMQFNYIVSHNLRSPIANLIGLSDIILKGQLEDAEKLKIITYIQASILKIDTTLKDLSMVLSMGSLVNKENEEIAIADLIATITNTLQIEELEVDYTLEIEPGAEMIFTIKVYLESILYNLISNAIKYKSPNRKLVLWIQVFKSGNTTKIIISDNGIGIDLDLHGSDLFGLYKRFNAEVEGKGMGLHMCKTQIETLGGQIEVESALDKGTTFVLVIPNHSL